MQLHAHLSSFFHVLSLMFQEKFYETFGIDVVKKRVENHLCRFVNTNGAMHKQFTPHLRKDGMGIDYSKITYRFKDPAPNEK